MPKTTVTGLFLRTPFNHDGNEFSDLFGLECKDPSLAQQQFKDECDINTIVDRFHLSGEVPTVLDLPVYADFTGVFDYQSAMNAIVAARETFMSLPAKLRSRFHNDPQEFVAFCSDDKNRDEAKKLGLLRDEPATIQPPNNGQPTGATDETRTQGTTATTTQGQTGSTRTPPNPSAPAPTQKP